MWKKLNESVEDVTEDEILKDLEGVYQQLENIRKKLNRSYDIELRMKYMRTISDVMNILDCI